MENELILRQQEGSQLAALSNSPEQYCKALNPRRIEDVFLSHEPLIGTIIKNLGETKARAAVVYLLADALEFFNAADTMSDVQVAMTVDLIIEEYAYMKLDDIKLCFKNAMKMKYGKIYNRIDGQVIMSWFKEYNKERCSTADNQSYNEHKAHNAEEAKPTNGLFYEEYRAELESRAKDGDEEAIKALELSNSISEMLCQRKFVKQKENLDKFYTSDSKRNV